MASRAHRWKGDDTPLTGRHGGTKEAALRAIAEARGFGLPAKRLNKAAERRATIIAERQAEWEQLLSKLPPIPAIKAKAGASERLKRIEEAEKRRPPRQKKRPRAWLADLMREQNGQCYYCEKPMLLDPPPVEQKRKATIDHFIPLAKGGSNGRGNLVAACDDCNQRKADIMPGDYMANLQKRRDEMAVWVRRVDHGSPAVGRFLDSLRDRDAAPRKRRSGAKAVEAEGQQPGPK